MNKDKPGLFLKIFSLFIWVILILNTIFWDTLQLLICPLNLIDRKRKMAHWISMQWGKVNIAINPFWEFKVQGLENLDKKKTYVIVSNHQSMGDIFVLYLLSSQFKWMAKASLFKIPFLGWAMSLSGYIKLRRGERGSIRDSFEDATSWIDRGISVHIFPEGTRSETGEMRAFKNGAFKLAERKGVPILPVVLFGTRGVLAKGTWVFRQKVKGCVSILPAISSEGQSFEELKDKARKVIGNELTRLKGMGN